MLCPVRRYISMVRMIQRTLSSLRPIEVRIIDSNAQRESFLIRQDGRLSIRSHQEDFSWRFGHGRQRRAMSLCTQWDAIYDFKEHFSLLLVPLSISCSFSLPKIFHNCLKSIHTNNFICTYLLPTLCLTFNR